LTCSACGKAFNGDLYCSAWKTHEDPKTQWIPLKFQNQFDEKEPVKRKASSPAIDNPIVAEKVKLLKAARKEVKRARAEAKNQG